VPEIKALILKAHTGEGTFEEGSVIKVRLISPSFFYAQLSSLTIKKKVKILDVDWESGTLDVTANQSLLSQGDTTVQLRETVSATIQLVKEKYLVSTFENSVGFVATNDFNPTKSPFLCFKIGQPVLASVSQLPCKQKKDEQREQI
jgi:hypothetical protein